MNTIIYTFELAPRRVVVFNPETGGAEVVQLPDSTAPTDPDQLAALTQQAGRGAVWVEDPSTHPHTREALAFLAEYTVSRAGNLCDSCSCSPVCAVRLAVESTGSNATVGTCERYVAK